MPKKINPFIQRIFNPMGLEVRRLPKIKSSGVFSRLDEQIIAKKYLDSLNISSKYCVDIAAMDGVTMSNTLALYKEGWGGLAVEFDSENFSSLAYTYKDFKNVNLAKCMVTPLNVLSLLAAHQVPKEFGFLNLDIDGYDYYVLEQILLKYRPSLMCVEINEKIPPPIKFTVKWSSDYVWAGDHFYGQSLSQLCLLCAKHNYALVELHYNNAFLVPLELEPRTMLSAEEAYNSGYLNMPDRKHKFPWNENMEEVLTMNPKQALAFIEKFFSEYRGKFDAFI
jgi:hypothetical protein